MNKIDNNAQQALHLTAKHKKSLCCVQWIICFHRGQDIDKLQGFLIKVLYQMYLIRPIYNKSTQTHTFRNRKIRNENTRNQSNSYIHQELINMKLLLT